jgi:hypothetical protein
MKLDFLSSGLLRQELFDKRPTMRMELIQRRYQMEDLWDVWEYDVHDGHRV